MAALLTGRWVREHLDRRHCCRLLLQEGFYNLWNWFDDRTWYPLGRVIGGTVYPVRVFAEL